MQTHLAHTPLYSWHASAGGRLVDFAGWEMPVQYGSIVTEHEATRKAATLFDVSHMGRLRFDGPAAEAFLDKIVTRKVTGMKPGQVRYSLVTNDAGGVLDDVLVYRLVDSKTGGTYYQMVVNASNRQKILVWLEKRRAAGFGPGGPEIGPPKDLTFETAMIAVQGPKAAALVEPLVGPEALALKYYHAVELPLNGFPDAPLALVGRTGYTGEDGWELVVPARRAVAVWERLLEVGKPVGAMAAGLAARDTLRLEAAMPLYGHELSEEIHPFQAGLDFAVNLDDRWFPGHDALEKARREPSRLIRVGWELAGRRVPRENYPVLSTDGAPIGHVTSGTFSPTLDRPIAMGYCQPAFARPGSAVAIDIRGRHEPATVVELPFYRRGK
ncbi:MAG TPA: glycine cleavage system aminomethyltransferase GcvT [Pirellulales bacterium]|nr:glycine cleavage system aminomethyltransferase GcvT [Pirellulales bacterium]